MKSENMSYLHRPWMFNWKIDGCENNLGYSSTTKIGKHIPCG